MLEKMVSDYRFLPLMKGEIKRGLEIFQPPPIPLLHKEGELFALVLAKKF